MDLIKKAKQFVDAGYSVIPVNSTKNPAIPQWGIFQVRAMTHEEIEKYFKGAWGIALLCGGEWGVVGLDFDLKYDLTNTLFDRYKEKVPNSLLKKMYVQTTKNQGYHLAFKAPASRLTGNKKLASRGTTAYERDNTYRQAFDCPSTRDMATKIAHNDKSRVLIETRSGSPTTAGGYILIAPTQGYTKVFGKINTITEDEYDLLMDVATSFNEVIDFSDRNPSEFGGDWEKNPIDDYNERGDIVQVLLDNGWTITNPNWETDRNVRLKRPGQTHSASSALFDNQRRIFVCFSTSCEFDPNEGYSAFGTYAMLEHDNNFTNAFKQLVVEGYGKR